MNDNTIKDSDTKDIGEGTIRRIDWTELVPAVLLLRIFNTALGLRILGIALAGVVLSQLLSMPLLNMADILPIRSGDDIMHHSIFSGMLTLEDNFFTNTVSVFDHMSRNLLFTRNSPLPPLLSPLFEGGIRAFYFAGMIGLFGLIGVICGTAICRIAAVRLTIDESESSRHLCRFVLRRCGSIINAVFIVTVGIFLCYLPVYLAGKLLTVPVAGFITGIFLPVPIFFAILTAILLIGLFAGFPLLFAAVCTDASDGFDAVSRTFSYIYQRPFHYILYWIYSGVLGYLGFLLVWFFLYVAGTLMAETGVVPIGEKPYSVMIWVLLVAHLPAAYQFAWFFTSGTAIYLLLRRSVDAAPLNEVYRSEPVKMRYLPKIQENEIKKSVRENNITNANTNTTVDTNNANTNNTNVKENANGETA